MANRCQSSPGIFPISDPFPWTLVGADAIEAVAAAARLRLASQHRFGGRFCTVLEVA